MSLNEKHRQLLDWFRQQENIAVAFSGGTDSTFVLAVARQVLNEKAMAISVKTPYIPEWEMEEAISFCKKKKISHHIISESIIPEIVSNPQNRCYLCKRHIFTLLKDESGKMGYHTIADGSNTDDTGVYRPGLKALSELGIKSPLIEVGITKKEIRELSRQMGLETADKPPYACLLTRLPYNYNVNIAELERIEKAELFMASIGFAHSRVRNHHETARIEIEPERINEFIQSSKKSGLTNFFREIGYKFVSLDLDGYRSGCFDESLKNTIS